MTEKFLRQEERVFVRCGICGSDSPESQERLRAVARLGLVRFLVIAREARIQVTMEQQLAIYQTLLEWDCAGMPTEVDLLIHEYADRAMHFAILSFDLDPRLITVKESMPAWNANWKKPYAWNIPAEHRIADQLKPILRDAGGWNLREDDLAVVMLKKYLAGRDGVPEPRNDGADTKGDDID